METTKVPARKKYEIPSCPKCGQSFKPYPQPSANQWESDCDCLEPNSWNFPDYGDARHLEMSPLQSQIGKEVIIHCLRCDQEMIPGYGAVFGEFQHGYNGYAHPACARAWNDLGKNAEEEYAQADAGIHITCWFSSDAKTRMAPSAGHRDAEYRPLPADLPELPEGAVVDEWYRAPFAVVAILVPNEKDAEKFWNSAKIRDAGYELHWFPRGSKDSTRHFTGRGFSHAESHAAQLEIEAGTI